MENGILNVVVKKVDDIDYEVVRLDPFAAFRLKAKLMKRLLPALGALIGKGNFDTLFEKDFDVAAGLTVLAANMDEDELTLVVREFLKPICRDGKPINPTTEFTGHDNRMLKLFWAALEVNYSDFFDSLPSLWEKGQDLLAKARPLNRDQRRSTKRGRAGASGSAAKPA